MPPIKTRSALPDLGFGLGLRPRYYPDLLDREAPVDWLEILTENYLVPGGPPLHHLRRAAERYPLVMHGVSMSLGSTDPVDFDYLAAVKGLKERIEPHWISDHLCWTGVNGLNLHDLMPLPLTEEALRHVADRIAVVQEFLGQRLVVENVSSYLTYRHSAIPEWEFLAALADAADCLLLLDVNNIFVSAFNHGFDASTYLRAIPPARIAQIHIAGHSNLGTHIIDTHDQPIVEGVYALYAEAVDHVGPVSTMIERDDNFPPFEELISELETLRKIAGRAKAVAA